MLRRRIVQALVTPLIVLLAVSSVPADEIIMKNGSRLIGELISAESDKIIFNTSFAGRITINQENVERITTQEPVTFMLENGTVYRDRQIISTEKSLLLESKNDAYVIFDAADINMINPEPWKIGEGYKWNGDFSLALEFERGNSVTGEWDLKANSVWRSLEDRYTLKGDMEYEESRSIKKNIIGIFCRNMTAFLSLEVKTIKA